MANSVDLDKLPHSLATYLDLKCLLRPFCPNVQDKYGILNQLFACLILVSFYLKSKRKLNAKKNQA